MTLRDVDHEGTLARLLSLPTAQRIKQEMAIVDEFVDVAYYVLTNPEVTESGLDPIEHFCTEGWQDLRKPRRDFDVWWYWSNHMDPADDSVNPLVHYALVGRELGLSTRPESTVPRPTRALATDRPIRRAALVAGFDGGSVIDPSVIALITELNRHSDVFYLSDGYIRPEELAKLDDITVGRWAIRHAAYDFGSYAKLATELVGWDRLNDYDEVILANDSCFLLKPLDDVFDTMAARPCDWWGLQATKGMADSSGLGPGRVTQPVPIDVVKAEMLDHYEDDPVYTFHIGSYFMVFRQPVMHSEVFRRFFESVGPQTSKRAIVVKYEMGLTHLLIGNGYSFDTFIDKLYPFHPMFSEWYFNLVEDGFPLLKRFLIYRNHYDVPDLARWKERIRALVPDADVDMFERTLQRTAPDDALHRSYSLTADSEGRVLVPQVVKGTALRKLNRKTRKREDFWTFAVDRLTHELPDSSRAIFEAIKDDDAITKIVLTRSQRVELTGSNVVTEPVKSVRGRELLLQSGRVFTASNLRASLEGQLRSERGQTIVIVRDGLQLEASGRTTAEPSDGFSRTRREGVVPSFHVTPPRSIDGVLAASDVDQLAALATNWPARYEQVWRTGLPAHDFLQQDEHRLPADMQAQMAAIRAQLGGRRLLLYSPVRRGWNSVQPNYPFTPVDVSRIREWCVRHDFALGVREHQHDMDRFAMRQFADFALDLSPGRYQSVHAVLRTAEAMLTDYSSVALDFATRGKPVISFAHDLELARDGLLYDLDHFFPGPVCKDFESLVDNLDFFVDNPRVSRHERVREMLVDHHDGRNTERVLARLADVEGDDEA